MSFQDQLKTCEYCQKGLQTPTQAHKPTISVKSASSYSKQKKLSELAAIIKGISYPSLESMPMFQFQTKGPSFSADNISGPGPIEREVKLKELGKMVRSR
jgi:hypothetical protein